MRRLDRIGGYPVLAQRPAYPESEGQYETVVVLCWRPNNGFEPFVTWLVNLGSDDQPYAALGHYFSSIKEAGADFEERHPAMVRE